MNFIKTFIICLFSIFFLTKCTQQKIEITTEYIINGNWNEQARAIQICKMKLKKDSTIDHTTTYQGEILDKLIEDSSFIYHANIRLKGLEVSYSRKRVYFNRDNGFEWGDGTLEGRRKVLGKLEQKNWYRFSYLVTYRDYLYIYIDSVGKLYRFDVNLSNY